jgi:hypothetical protein
LRTPRLTKVVAPPWIQSSSPPRDSSHIGTNARKGEKERGMGKIKTPLSLIVLFLSGCLSPSRYRAADAFATTPTLPALFRSSCLTSGGGGGGRWGRNTTPLCMKWDLAGLDWDVLWGITSGFCRTDVGKSAFLRSSHFASSPRYLKNNHRQTENAPAPRCDGMNP